MDSHHSYRVLPPRDEEVVYDFIRDKTRSPLDRPTSEVVYALLVDKQADQEVVAALDRIVKRDDFSGDQGLLFINRCIYTAINPLHLDGSRHDDLKRLVESLKTAPEQAMNATTKKLRRTLRRYIEDEKYQCVLRQARLYENSEPDAEPVIGNLFPDYSFLYVHAGVTRDIQNLDGRDRQTKDVSRRIKLTEGIQRKRKEKIYALRTALNVYIDHHKKGTLQPGHNPTHLTDEELVKGLRCFNTAPQNSFRARAIQFRGRYTPGQTVHECRDDVLEYMSQPLSRLPHHRRELYQEKFHKALQDMETTNGAMRSTVIQAFKKILDSLMFVGYKANRAERLLEKHVQAISPCGFAAILLNLVLGCPMIFHKLEERLSSLYVRYEKQAVKSLTWLVQFFDYMHLALVMNFRYLMSHETREESQIPKSVIWPA
ncbi:MAG: hypothetical protein AAFQ89_19770 [Cyanobacteria bacterium J06626_18]